MHAIDSVPAAAPGNLLRCYLAAACRTHLAGSRAGWCAWWVPAAAVGFPADCYRCIQFSCCCQHGTHCCALSSLAHKESTMLLPPYLLTGKLQQRQQAAGSCLWVKRICTEPWRGFVHCSWQLHCGKRAGCAGSVVPAAAAAAAAASAAG
jgi:hypothetical protein